MRGAGRTGKAGAPPASALHGPEAEGFLAPAGLPGRVAATSMPPLVLQASCPSSPPLSSPAAARMMSSACSGTTALRMGSAELPESRGCSQAAVEAGSGWGKAVGGGGEVGREAGRETGAAVE